MIWVDKYKNAQIFVEDLLATIAWTACPDLANLFDIEKELTIFRIINYLYQLKPRPF